MARLVKSARLRATSFGVGELSTTCGAGGMTSGDQPGGPSAPPGRVLVGIPRFGNETATYRDGLRMARDLTRSIHPDTAVGQIVNDIPQVHETDAQVRVVLPTAAVVAAECRLGKGLTTNPRRMVCHYTLQ